MQSWLLFGKHLHRGNHSALIVIERGFRRLKLTMVPRQTFIMTLETNDSYTSYIFSHSSTFPKYRWLSPLKRHDSAFLNLYSETLEFQRGPSWFTTGIHYSAWLKWSHSSRQTPLLLITERQTYLCIHLTPWHRARIYQVPLNTVIRTRHKTISQRDCMFMRDTPCSQA